ncbi:MAG: DUF882 domain-containing protein [Armatimonadota bacterium]|nr:DUF882 domain-containing protein [Armatimonadota bacterium]
MKAAVVSAIAWAGPAVLVRPALARTLPEGRLLLYNLHTEERLDVTYRDPTGTYDHDALAAIDRLLRCHYSGRVASIDVRLIEFLHAVDRQLGGPHHIHVVSGYRSPEYNEWLIRHGRGAAKNSLHVEGKAVDIRIPDVGLDALRRAAQSLGYGGVGYYPRPGFVHLDSGRPRLW